MTDVNVYSKNQSKDKVVNMSNRNPNIRKGARHLSGRNISSKKITKIPDENRAAVESEQNEIMQKKGERKATDPLDYGFGIDATALENIMGKYKERGTEYLDLKYFILF